MKETIVISLGGSLIVPDEIDVEFLKKFRKLIISFLKSKRFIIIAGGGKTARIYMNAASKLVSPSNDDKDWLGIHATRINAHLLQIIFKNYAEQKIIKNPTEKIEFKRSILTAAGWKPGCSTDYDAVLLAEKFHVKKLINLSNVTYVYDKDPKKFKNARKIERISWKNFRRIVGNKWNPGLNVPFDPIASKKAEELGLKVIITNGKELRNLKNIFNGKRFRGTVIVP